MVNPRSSRKALCTCGSGLDSKNCCLANKSDGTAYEGPQRFGPQPVFSDGAGLMSPVPKPRARMQAIQRVGIDYTFPEQFGRANVWYFFPVGRLVVLDGGLVLPVERLEAGIRFVMQRGEIATVTAVEPPKWWEPPSDRPVSSHRYERRVIGKVEHIGNVVIDLTLLGQTVTTTPDHLFRSATRNAYVPAGELRPGELLVTDNGGTARLDSISPPRNGLVKLYNIEVEELHNYFVGRPGGAVLVHNGVPGAVGCGVPMPAEPGSGAAGAIEDGVYRGGGWGNA